MNQRELEGNVEAIEAYQDDLEAELDRLASLVKTFYCHYHHEIG